jgi:NADH-quinone oxidoreductase subunit H
MMLLVTSGVAPYLAQAESILDVGDTFIVPLLLKLAFVLGCSSWCRWSPATSSTRRWARMQHRRGPVEAGPFGTLQLVADGIKFIQKEDLIPSAADKWVFAIAPGVALVPAMLVFLVIPFGPGVFALDLELGLFYVLAASSVSVLGVLMGGWASANKFSLFGGLRAGGQLIAYELPLILAAIAVAVQAGTLSLVGIVEAQAEFMLFGTGINLWYVIPQVLGFGIFFVAALAELSRPPFDMPIGDSELVFGYMTEYTGIKYAMYMLTEYAGMVTMSALMVVLYLGGWQLLPGVPLPGCEGRGAVRLRRDRHAARRRRHARQGHAAGVRDGVAAGRVPASP